MTLFSMLETLIVLMPLNTSNKYLVTNAMYFDLTLPMFKLYPLSILENSEDNKNKNKINIIDTLKLINKIEIPIINNVKNSTVKSIKFLKA